MDITHVADFIEARYRDQEITPEQIEKKIRAVVEALDIFEEPEGMKIRFSIGKLADPDDPGLDDWHEDLCLSLAELPEDLKTKPLVVYEIWYDGDDEYEELCGIEVMLYQR